MSDNPYAEFTPRSVPFDPTETSSSSTGNPYAQFQPRQQDTTPEPIQPISRPTLTPKQMDAPPEMIDADVPESWGDLFGNLTKHIGEYKPPQFEEAKKLKTGTYLDDIALTKSLMAAGADTRNLVQGGLAMVNAGVQRGIQALPEQIPGGQGRSGFDEGDKKFFLSATKEVIKDTANRYVRPVLHGDVNAMLHQANTNPVSSFLDLAGGVAVKGGVAASKKLAPAVAKASKKAVLGVGGRQGLRNLRTAMKGPQKIFKDIRHDRAIMMFANEVMRAKFDEYLDWAGKITREIDRAYKHIPKETKKYLTSGAELVDEQGIARIDGSKTAQKFLNTVEDFWNQFNERLERAGVAPHPDEMFLARWGGAWLAELDKAGIKKSFGDLVKDIAADPEVLDDIKGFAHAMEATGKKPYWFPIRAAKDVADFLDKHAFSPLKQKGEDTSFLKPRRKARITDRDGVKTYHGPGTEMDAAKLAKDGLLRTLRAMYVQEAIEEILNNPLLGKRAEKWVAVNMNDVLKRTAVGAGAPTTMAERLAEHVAEHVEMPEKLAKFLENVASTDKGNVVWDLVVRKPKNAFSRFLLGVDVFRGAVQYPQNIGLYLWSSVKHPRDIPRATTAYLLSFHPEASKIVPSHFKTGQKALRALERGDDLPKALSALALPDKFLEMNMRVVEAGDNQVRIAKAIKEAMDEVYKLPPAERQHLTKGMKLTQWGEEKLQEAFNNPKLQDKFHGEVKKWLGDYNRPVGQGGQLLHDLFVFPRMVEHLAGVAAAMPFDTPLKTAVLSRIQHAFPEVAQKGVPEIYQQSGAVLARDKEGKPMVGPNDKPLIYSKGTSFTPFSMGAELAESAFSFLDPTVDPHLGGIGLNPVANEIMLRAGINPRTFRNLRHPNMDTAGGRQVPEDAVQAHIEKQRELRMSDFLNRPTPPFPASELSTFFPRQMGPVNKAFEANTPDPGVPTQFTDPFDPQHGHAPKVGEFGKTIKPMPINPGTVLFDRLQPTEAFLDTEDEEGMLQSNIRKAIKSHAFRKKGREERKKKLSEDK